MPGPNPIIPPEIAEELQTERSLADVGLNEKESEGLTKAESLEVQVVKRLRELEARHPRIMVHPVVDRWKAEALKQEAVEAASVALQIAAGLHGTEHSGDTPRRFIEMLMEMTTAPDLKWRTFKNEGMDEMIVQRNIPFASLCEHHILPFIGICHVGYVPRDHIVGLSKLTRVVQHFAHALQIQERLTAQIADFLQENLQARGVAVIVDAEHLCMTVRGAQAPGTRTSTAAMLGVFADHERTAKAEFLSRVNGGS